MRHLTISLVALAALLAPPLAAQETMTLDPQALTLTRTPPGDYYLIPVINGYPVLRGSPECAPVTSQTYVPAAARVRLVRQTTINLIGADIGVGALTTPLSRDAWRQALTMMLDVEPRFADRPLYGTYVTPPGWTPNCGTFWCGCVHGIGSWPPQIAVDDPTKVEALIAWETTNAALTWLKRSDLWDGSYVSSVTTRVRDMVGGWQTE